MKMKKIVSLFTAGVLMTTALFTGCGSSSEYNIGLCQLVQHEALDSATKGFQDSLTEKLGDRVHFNLQNAAGDSATCSTIINQFVSSNDDLIFANATPALQAAASATDTIPIVGTSITDYATALSIDNWEGSTGRNITGTADLAPLDGQADMIKELVPDKKTVGLLYCSSEANSKYQIDIMTKELTERGYSCVSYPFADSNDVAQVTTTAKDSCDILYIPTDNTAAANAEIIANVVDGKVPVFSGEEGICRACGIATLAINYESIGRIAGDMAYEILVNKKDPSTMKIKYADNIEKKYVKERTDALGIKVPNDYVELSTTK